MKDVLKKDCFKRLHEFYMLDAWSINFIMKKFDYWAVLGNEIHACMAMIADYTAKDDCKLKYFELERKRLINFQQKLF